MKYVIAFIVGLVFFNLNSHAQQLKIITGTVQDTAGVTLPSALVKLRSVTDSLAVASDIDGNFKFQHVKDSLVTISVNYIGFKPFVKSFKISRNLKLVNLGAIKLSELSNSLKEVNIVGVIPVILKEDTVQYDASAFKVREGDAVAEVIKKLPGVEVDKNGNITAQGEAVTKVRLNGKDYFGDDVAAAIQNLPADIVQNLQIIDDYGDQANITGLKTGTPQKILNINLQPDKKKGYFAKSSIGAGSERRYSGGIKANILNDDEQLSFEADLNNTEGRSAGTSENKSVKLNYRNNWGKKVVSYGSYRFNNQNNNTLEHVFSQNIYQDYTRFEEESNNNNALNNNHNLAWNFEIRPDDANYIKIEPDVAYNTAMANNSGLTNTQILQASSLRQSSQRNYSSSLNFGAKVFYNHKFEKPRRNFSLNANLNSSSGNEDRNVRNDYTNTDSLGTVTEDQQYQLANNDNNNISSQLRAAYIEPLSQSDFLELSYDWSRSKTGNFKETKDVDPVSNAETPNLNLSSNYDYTFITNRIGLNYRFKKDKLNYALGVSAQPSALLGTDIGRAIQTNKKTFNWIPTARLVYRFSKEKVISAKYNGSSRQPSFIQLQPITDNSNLQNTVTGNPDLKPEFIHQMKVEYKQTGLSSGYMMHANLSFDQVQDKIVTSKVIIPDSLRQETSYINTNGFYSARGRYSLSVPLSKRKYMITWYGGSDFSNNVAFSNNERNIGKNLGITQGLKFRLDLEDIMDSELNTSYTYNTTSYSGSSFTDRHTSQISLGLQGRNYFLKNWILGYDFSQTFNEGFNTAINNPTLLSFYLEHRFLKGKKGSIKLQGFDLLNQNTGVSRDVFDNEIVDRQSNRLTTYFLISFNFRLQRFGGG
ncbi:outer membrane beta-barrel protein [Pedobacter heparinus]|uniref:outer membrane beta-barrel protein n=1 Tax=Pedobacter heparinus TaxID=984 RepID=UPI00292D2936|nr:outer membrane beta-barrel protein [Pedobacter heparinus]